MKLLGWMHSKLKHKGNEPANNTTIAGNSMTCFSAHKEVKSNGAEMDFQEEQFDEIFPGFLAIGTLGNNYQTTNTDPPTPTFPMPFEYVETDITEKELKFINDELEKFLEEKLVNEAAYEPSERTIALSDDKLIQTGPTDCCGNMEECPLQKYLLGSSVELPDIEEEVKQQKTFLEELFKKKNIVQVCDVGNEGKEKKQGKKKHAAHFMKKLLRNLHSKSKSSTTDSSKGKVTGSVSSKRKLPQVLKMFHRKVHPVNENNLQDNETSNISCKAGNSGAISEASTKFSPKKEVINREHWIKTDSDFLVLEL
ncbi:protein LAZY 1 [Capsicum annuum]|uniref:protein LAZY 1 n=1 Tax=Capsicum annuum TaxID=4072 RepID=UPI0007BFAC81|nr:protein LAZY 1 [Capsicum annuum]